MRAPDRSANHRHNSCCRPLVTLKTIPLSGNAREFPFVVLGNMIDKCGITVEATKNAVAWCVDHGNLPYYETSATEGYNVDRAFQFVLEKAAAMKASKPAGGAGGMGYGQSPAMNRRGPATPASSM